MRAVLKFLAAMIFVGVLALGVVLGKTFLGNRPLTDGTPVTQGVTLVKDGYVAAYVVDTSARTVALVDCGMAEDGAPILATLAARGLGADAVQAIFLTHGHKDHTGGCRAFPKAAVYALAPEAPIVEGREATHGPLPGLFGPYDAGVTVAHPVEDGAAVTLGDTTFRAYALPGHTVGSVAWSARGVLFLGDSANADADGALEPAPWIFSDNPDENVASLVGLSARLPDGEGAKLAFGHAGPIQGPGPLRAFAALAR